MISHADSAIHNPYLISLWISRIEFIAIRNFMCLLISSLIKRDSNAKKLQIKK